MATKRKPKAEEVSVGEPGADQLDVVVDDGLWRVDPGTGELCVGNECFQVKIDEDGGFVMEMNPNAETCNPEARERITKALLAAAEGRAEVKFRRGATPKDKGLAGGKRQRRSATA